MNKSPVSFVAKLNRILARTMRQLQLHSGASKDFLRCAVRRLNDARRYAKRGFMATAEFCVELALNHVRNAKAWANA